ncbi:MAG: rod shape-determining protein MreC [Gemmatimonadaceae bacterium]
MVRAVRSSSRTDAVLLGACVVFAGVLAVLPNSARERVAGALRRTVVQPVLRLQSVAEQGRNAIVERDALTRRLDSLALSHARLTALELENERLRRLIGLGRAVGTGFVAAEVVHTQSLGDEHTVTLTAGASAGVTARSIVVAPDGVVGMVTAVDPATSLAILWTHPDFRVSAQSLGSNVLGIVRPHRGDEGEGYLLELTGVAFRDSLLPGTHLVSSGLGGRYPTGIPVGTVIGEVRTGEGWARTYVVRPAVKPQDVTSVMVIQPERLKGAAASSIWQQSAETAATPERIAAPSTPIPQPRGAAMSDTSPARPSAAVPRWSAPTPPAESAARLRRSPATLLDSLRAVPDSLRPTPRRDTARSPSPSPPARRDTARPRTDTPRARPSTGTMRGG